MDNRLPRLSGTIFLANWEWERPRAIEISRVESRRQGLRDPVPSSRNPDYCGQDSAERGLLSHPVQLSQPGKRDRKSVEGKVGATWEQGQARCLGVFCHCLVTEGWETARAVEEVKMLNVLLLDLGFNS